MDVGAWQSDPFGSTADPAQLFLVRRLDVSQDVVRAADAFGLAGPAGATTVRLFRNTNPEPVRHLPKDYVRRDARTTTI
jgi:hypothetical protein